MYGVFKTEIFSNLKMINLLDVTFNLNDNSFKPFNKSNNISTYIIVSSNHPSFIIRQIRKAVNIRRNGLSSKKIFNNHKEFYNEALHRSGYKKELDYSETRKH